MQRGVYSAGSAMMNAQTALDVIAQNLANASTTAYRRDGIAFNETLNRQMADHAGNGRPLGTLGAAPGLTVRYTDFSPGPISETGRPLDVALRGDGAFAVQTPNGVRYTRDGSFTLDAQQRLVTSDGFPVLDTQNRPIGPLEGQVEIAENGDVTAGGLLVTRLGVFQGDFAKEGRNLCACPNPQAVTQPTLVPRALEGSNVQAVEEMIAMIKTQRVFEMAQRSATSQDEITQRLIQTLNTR